MSNRPKKLIAVIGTGTEVGKTWFAAELLTLARDQGYQVAARKPVQSFALDDSSQTDAERLAETTGEAKTEVCPQHRWYPLAMAPPMAADALALPRILLADLMKEITWPKATDIGLVETAGGLCSPLAHDADNVRMLQALRPDHVVLVADAGLGTINAIRLCLLALTGIQVSVFLNRFDTNNQLHTNNQLWLREQYQIETSISTATCWARINTDRTK